jgi:hypothetical protein
MDGPGCGDPTAEQQRFMEANYLPIFERRADLSHIAVPWVRPGDARRPSALIPRGPVHAERILA